MDSLKFDEIDREKVISEIETHFTVTLSRVGRRRKCLADQNGRTFWVLGGYKNWHGIPQDMLKKEQAKSTDGILVVAKRDTSKIDIFTGALQKLIDNEESLSHTQNGDFQFNIDIRGNRLLVKEVPELVLTKIGAQTFGHKEKNEDRKVKEEKETGMERIENKTKIEGSHVNPLSLFSKLSGWYRLLVVGSFVWFLVSLINIDPWSTSFNGVTLNKWDDFLANGVLPIVALWGIIWIVRGFKKGKD